MRAKILFVVFVLASFALAGCIGGTPAPQTIVVTATPEATPSPSGEEMMATVQVLFEATLTAQAAEGQAEESVPATKTPAPTATFTATLPPSAECPNDPKVTIVWPGFNSPNDLNRYGVGYGKYEKVCFPNGGAILASYVRINGRTFDDVARCDRDKKPEETCGYLLNIPPGVVAEFHTGVSGTIYPDAGGELYGDDGNIHPWIVDITAEVFPYQP